LANEINIQASRRKSVLLISYLGSQIVYLFALETKSISHTVEFEKALELSQRGENVHADRK
jgi:hypothetical protein